MSEQRRQILQMLAEGTITADEAERLIDAVERGQAGPARPETAGPKPRPRYLRVVVEDTFLEGMPSRVNVRVPLKLLRAGVRLTSVIPAPALARLNAEIGKSGFPIDLTELKPQHLEEFIDQIDELNIDIDEPGTKVQVFCE